MNRTFSPKIADINREWFVVDAEGQTLGRLCTQIARVLTGKHKPTYAPHLDTGDFVIVVNAEKTETAAELRRRRPTRLIRKGLWGMLPKNQVGRRQLKKLKIYAGAEHPHEAQQPQPFPLAG